MLHPDKPPTLNEEHPEGHKQWQTKALAGEKVSAATFNREFELEDILDYIKSGIGAIIEDEVTQRFQAEELKTWNLLTRTQTLSFEHVNARLTLVWGAGFVVRYFVLLPGRLVIFAVGVIIKQTSVNYDNDSF